MDATILMPLSLDEAVDALARDPRALPVAGGTDLMPRVNAELVRPSALVGLAKVADLRRWGYEDGFAMLGAGLTWARLADADLAALVPALAAAANEVGTAQVRAMGTLGGNILASGRPADSLPVLAALEATVSCRSPGGVREVAPHLLEPRSGPIAEQLLRPGELITGVRVPLLRGVQEFVKAPVGAGRYLTLALVAGPVVGDVRCAVGGAHPGPVRAFEAERWLAGRMDARTGRLSDVRDAADFGRLVADEVRPEAEQRAARAHLRHVVAVCARRAVQRAFGG